MPDKLQLEFLPKRGGYDWINIERSSAMVGKLRGLIEDNTFTVYSINIFPEFAGNGYGKETIGRLKGRFEIIVADRVRYKAIGFWESIGFMDRGDGCYEYRGRLRVGVRESS